MTTKDFDKLGNECIDHLTALNPKGGIKVFVRMAVEFGYQRAVKNLTILRVSNSVVCNIGMLPKNCYYRDITMECKGCRNNANNCC